ncbi:hypothetical protein [Ancylobacter polymorphus]|uniref:Uncharacterized protein n=1 Tax=Ancylobacter polymorphus TaxID=223390 RepID=A0ABU0B6D5_9HYPH|nr:hypothetical protein [Ancylobacter polymorphus]MDQ0301377.1 hypothetical protein [Ancylobacter polymorphus]
MDSAFPTARYPSYTTAELGTFIAEGRDSKGWMRDEIERRAAVAAGDMSRSTAGERLYAARERASR